MRARFTLACAVLLAVRDAGESLPAAAALISPWPDLTCSGASYTWRGESELHPEASLGLDAIWDVAEGHRFEIHGDVFLDLGDTDEFRTHSTADWNFALTEMLGLTVGVIHDSVSDTARKGNDITYRGALTVDI